MSSNVSPEARVNFDRLVENVYPGRGIIQGLNAGGDTAIQAYWLMGRSDGSRARVLVQDVDDTSSDGRSLVRTEPFKMPEGSDTSLTIYTAMRRVGDTHVVTNGDQTDTVAQFLTEGGTFEHALDTRDYEPDAPNFTPRISGVIELGRDAPATGPEAHFSVIRKSIDSALSVRAFANYALTPDTAGTGRLIHTYGGDGTPLPSFVSTPRLVPLGETIEEIAKNYWEALNPDNKVAIVVKGIGLKTGEETYEIINALESAA